MYIIFLFSNAYIITFHSLFSGFVFCFFGGGGVVLFRTLFFFVYWCCILISVIPHKKSRARRGHDGIVVGFTTTYVISVYHH